MSAELAGQINKIGKAKLALPVNNPAIPFNPQELLELGVGYANVGPTPPVLLMRSLRQMAQRRSCSQWTRLRRDANRCGALVLCLAVLLIVTALAACNGGAAGTAPEPTATAVTGVSGTTRYPSTATLVPSPFTAIQPPINPTATVQPTSAPPTATAEPTSVPPTAVPPDTPTALPATPVNPTATVQPTMQSPPWRRSPIHPLLSRQPLLQRRYQRSNPLIPSTLRL